MEQIRIFITQLKKQLEAFFGRLTLGRKIFIGVAFVAILGLFGILIMWKPDTDYVVAYQHLTPEDKNAILAVLNEHKIRDIKIGDNSVSFPAEKALDYKMLLAQEGLPSSGVGVGWEKFDDKSFGLSDFEQKINKLRALQGELARTINRLDSVESSRVHIVLPEDAVFSDEKPTTTASIFLRLSRGKTLSQKQIQGIIHLVANGVDGLSPQHVTIVDQDGNMLTQPEEHDGGVDKVTGTQRKYQRQVERELEGKIAEILARLVGHDKVVAKVEADLEFKKIETTISDVDPDRTAVIASQRTDQSMQGSGLNPTGVPGAKSNLPGEREDLQNPAMTNSSSSNSENLNYEVKKTLSKIVEPVGQVKKISVSVLVDYKVENDKAEPRSKEDMQKIESLVKNAIGFEEKRGDTITVQSTKFELDKFEAAEKAILSSRQGQLFQSGIFGLVTIFIMLFIYMALVKPYFKWLMYDPEKRSKEEFGVVDYELERTGMSARRVQQQEEVPFDKLSPKEQIIYLAKHDPKKTTEAIRQLLSPNSQ